MDDDEAFLCAFDLLELDGENWRPLEERKARLAKLFANLRSRFMSLSLWTSLAAFILIEGYALIDQLEIGHASLVFMLGTALLAAAACIGLFAIITAIGLAISTAFSDEPPQQQQSQGPLGGIRPINDRSDPRTYTGIKTDATGRPALLSKSKRHFRRFGS